MATIHVKTESGFECDINEMVLDDMEVLDYLVAIDDGDSTKYPKLLAKILTPEAKKALYDYVRTEDGRVPYAALSPEISDIIHSIKNGKN